MLLIEKQRFCTTVYTFRMLFSSMQFFWCILLYHSMASYITVVYNSYRWLFMSINCMHAGYLPEAPEVASGESLWTDP